VSFHTSICIESLTNTIHSLSSTVKMGLHNQKAYVPSPPETPNLDKKMEGLDPVVLHYEEEKMRRLEKRRCSRSRAQCLKHEAFWRFFLSGLLMIVAGVVWVDRFKLDGTLRNFITTTVGEKLSAKWESPTCGSTPEEAKANGCLFDIMHYAWVPELCYYPMLAEDEFRKFENNTWYSDVEHSQAIDTNLITKGEVQVVYNTLEYREYQCAYGWKMIRRALMTRTTVDTRTSDLDESAYCAELIFTDLNTSDKPTSKQFVRFELEYLTCSRLSSTRLFAEDYHPH
jgi:hypothetical protein